MRSAKHFGTMLFLAGIIFVGLGMVGYASHGTFLVINSLGPTTIQSVNGQQNSTSAVQTFAYPGTVNYISYSGSGSYNVFYYFNVQSGLSYADSSLYCVGQGCTPNQALPNFVMTSSMGEGYATFPSITLGQPYVMSIEVCDSGGNCPNVVVTMEYVKASSISYNAYVTIGSVKTLINCLSCGAEQTINVAAGTGVGFEVDISPSQAGAVSSLSASCAASSGGTCPWSTQAFTKSSVNSSIWTLSAGAIPKGAYSFVGTMNAVGNGGTAQAFAFGSNLQVKGLLLSLPSLESLPTIFLIFGLVLLVPGSLLTFHKRARGGGR